MSISLEDKCNELSMPSYYSSAFKFFSDHVNFKGAKVLEIGGSSIPKNFIDYLGCQLWTSVDIIGHEAGAYQTSNFPAHYASLGINSLEVFSDELIHPYEIFDGNFEKINNARESFYDLICSINCFEHLDNLDLALDRAYHKLKPGGYLVTQFGPIWSSIRGSHFWIDSSLNFMHQNYIPPYAHLIMSGSELEYYLTRVGLSEKIAKSIVHQHFYSDFINRRFYDDYLTIIDNSNFKLVTFNGLWDFSPPDYVAKILNQKYSNSNFSSIGIQIILSK